MIITEKIRRKRGCLDCADVRKEKMIRSGNVYEVVFYCKHDVCPYHELDNINDYNEWLRKWNKLDRMLDRMRPEARDE